MFACPFVPSGLGLRRCLTYTVMSNHIHLVLRVTFFFCPLQAGFTFLLLSLRNSLFALQYASQIQKL